MKFEKHISPITGKDMWLAWGIGFTGDPRKIIHKEHSHIPEATSLATCLYVKEQNGRYTRYPLYFYGQTAWKMRERLECRTALIHIRKAKARPREHPQARFTLHVHQEDQFHELGRAVFNPARITFLEFLAEFELLCTGQAPTN